MTSLFDRYGPWALICGASEGIAAGFARALAEAALLVLIASPRAAQITCRRPAHALAARSRPWYSISPPSISKLDSARSRKPESASWSTTPRSDRRPVPRHPACGPAHRRRQCARVIAAHVLGEPMAARGRGGIVLLYSTPAFWGSAGRHLQREQSIQPSLGEALARARKHGIDVVLSCAGATRTPGSSSWLRAARLQER
jgi:NAD(P)-dependent dehydrogenase (short-subunit alcohol dehydrogenase family)